MAVGISVCIAGGARPADLYAVADADVAVLQLYQIRPAFAPALDRLDNYVWLFADRPDAKFLGSLWVTVNFADLVPLNLLVSLLLALVLNQELRGVSFYRAVFYVPVMVPIVAAGILFADLYNVKYGIINNTLRAVGLPPSTWATRSETALQALIIMNLWGVGAGTVIWLAGLKSVPRELYEAASIDGANLLQRLRSITIPMITPVSFLT